MKGNSQNDVSKYVMTSCNVLYNNTKYSFVSTFFITIIMIPTFLTYFYQKHNLRPF